MTFGGGARKQTGRRTDRAVAELKGSSRGRAIVARAPRDGMRESELQAEERGLLGIFFVRAGSVGIGLVKGVAVAVERGMRLIYKGSLVNGEYPDPGRYCIRESVASSHCEASAIS